MSIRGHQDVFEVSKDIGFSKFKTKIPSFQISPPIIEQFGQFVLSVKNRKKLDAEKLSKLELQVATWKCNVFFFFFLFLKNRRQKKGEKLMQRKLPN